MGSAKIHRNIYPTEDITRINEITINSFRQFKNKTIPIAKRITIISGHNATGKSTLLAILANSCELRKIKPLIKNLFRGEFPEMIRASQEHDPTSNNVLVIKCSDISSPPNFLDVPFRATWQNNKTRYRLIPKHNGRESKLGYPVIYLGLSRLYPLGECSTKQSLSKPSIITTYFNKNTADKRWMINTYKNILTLNQVSDVDAKIHPDTTKVFVGIKNDIYNDLCNSAGQDNLGQILLAILSFRKAKNETIEKGEEWHGGLFLIDEVDASLHPAAQIRLMDLLLEEANNLDLQIIFTTHSLSILDYYHHSRKFRDSDDNNIIYLTTQNSDLDVKINPDIAYIHNDMLIIDPAQNTPKKITVFTEDEETRWFLKELLSEGTKRLIDLPEMHWGCKELAKLNHETYPALKNILFVLDGDFDDQQYQDFNVVVLPGGDSPEAVIYNYLLSLPSEHFLLNNMYGINKRTLNEYGPFSPKYTQSKNREKYKQWFQDNMHAFLSLNVLSFWIDSHKEEINSFNKNFLTKINSLQHI